MSKKKQKIKENDWHKYEEDSEELLYSYLKKKGKHKRGETSIPNK